MIKVSSWLVAAFFSFFGNPMHKYLLKSMFLRNPKQNKEESTSAPMTDEQRYKLLFKRTNIRLPLRAFTCLRTHREKRIIKEGSRRIEQEFDVKRMLFGLINTRVALKALFTKTEEFLIRNNKLFVLNSDISVD